MNASNPAPHPTHPPPLTSPAPQQPVQPFATYSHNFDGSSGETLDLSAWSYDTRADIHVTARAAKEQADPRQSLRIWVNGPQYYNADRQWPPGAPNEFTLSFNWTEGQKPMLPLPANTRLLLKIERDTAGAKNRDLDITVNWFR